MQPKISVIIPCYNHGAYLEEAILSVEENTDVYDCEIIIIDDGSSDSLTIEVLNSLERKGYHVIRQRNQGLAAARNNAITIARGKYILPLDSDNKLHKNYLTKAVAILEKDNSIGVVYGKPIFFGDEQGLREVGEFDFERLITMNYIDACAVFRRDIWVQVNGYDGLMPGMGNEDWEFWVHSFLLGNQFFYLQEVCFYYRVLATSMSASTTRPSYSANKEYIYKKHALKLVEKLLAFNKSLINSEEKNKLVINYITNNRLKAIVKLGLGRDIL